MRKFTNKWVLSTGILTLGILSVLFLAAFERGTTGESVEEAEIFLLDEAAEAIDLYFLAYAPAIERGGGTPDQQLWQNALNYDGGYFKVIAHEAMDRALGWDFMYPLIYEPNSMGQIRNVPSRTKALVMLETVRTALKEALIDESTDEIITYMDGFFSLYPDYYPLHVGRCYAHGHEYFPYDGTAACIADGLTRLTNYVIADVGEGINPKAIIEAKAKAKAEGVTAPAETCNCYYDWDCAFTVCFRTPPCQLVDPHPIDWTPGKRPADGICPE